jgi:hypothetical protein
LQCPRLLNKLRISIQCFVYASTGSAAFTTKNLTKEY